MATFDVLLPVRNGMAFFPQSLDSIRAQTFRDWRLLVLDHGSIDGSLELARDYARRDARIEVHSFPRAHGLSGLLNCGLELCEGKYVLRQDADDISRPRRMQVLLDALEADRELILVGSRGTVINAAGDSIGMLDMPTGPCGVVASTPFRSPVMHPTVAMRLDALRRLGARYGEDFVGAMPRHKRLSVPGLAEDYFLFGQLALLGRCENIAADLIEYRWHASNVSVLRYVDQMEMALRISRYLCESLALMHGTEAFDPAPFCNHGMNLFAVDGQEDFAREFAHMRASLEAALGPSSDLRREMAYRRTLADRRVPVMAARYAAFAPLHGVRLTEWRTVRSWLFRRVRKQRILTLTPSGLNA
ncbi:MAG TPA: glycosyltransferase family 2 protein [Burkholderiales bacterium]|nr:glycosyltransferase family 2 protein [Burkholderiales bacterium]